ncbi:DUF2203 family protein [Acidithiobacillus ferrivorans]|nr:DUF2203 family protein [Acidithiobacillus ferrivorans]
MHDSDGLPGHGDTVFAIQRPGQIRVFTLHEAEALFPLVRFITVQAHDELAPILESARASMQSHEALRQQEKRYEEIVRRWINKMERLGVVVAGLWLLDFDTGDGYLCWRYPEVVLGFYHGYDQGFSQRRPLPEILREHQPDWAASGEGEER